MWIVAKYNSKGLEVFKKELSERLDKDVKYYIPIISKEMKRSLKLIDAN